MTGSEYSPPPELVAAFTEADGARDLAARNLIADELRFRVLPQYQERENEAGEALAEAVAALKEPENHLAALEEEIAGAEAEAAQKRAQLDSGEFSVKVAARAWLAEYGNEVAALREKHRQQTDAIYPLRQARDQAQVRLDEAFRARRGLEQNCSPVWAYFALGPSTMAYKTYRVVAGALAPVLASGNSDYYEWDAGIAWLEFLCERTGFRTDHLPKDSERYRRQWDDILAQANPPQPPLTGAEVIGQMHARYESAALAKRGERTVQPVEDHRLRPVRIPMR